MPNVTFKVHATEKTTHISVPVLKHTHCDMPAFRNDPNFGGYANSNMFLQMVMAGLRAMKASGMIDANNPPAGVTIDKSKFLWIVTIDVRNWK